MDKFGYTQTQVTEKFKKTQAWVSYRLRLAERLSPQTKEAFITRVIKTSHARELAELPVDDQPAAVARIVNERLSFKDTETLVHAIEDHLDKKEEILAKPINELTPYPKIFKNLRRSMGRSSRSSRSANAHDAERFYSEKKGRRIPNTVQAARKTLHS